MLPGYQLRSGSRREHSLLTWFMQRTYQEIFPEGRFEHLADTVAQYFSKQTPFWLVETTCTDAPEAIACLWLGSAIDQMTGDRYSHIFLLYVDPAHRRRGIGSTLLHQAEIWARDLGDRRIGLQVLCNNQAALTLYEKLGYQTQALSLVKAIPPVSEAR